MPEKATHTKRVLLVDDNKDQVEVFVDLLTARGFDVETADDGPSAIGKLGHSRPNIAVIDIGLPGMDGYELARLIREQSPTTILVALTGWTREQDRIAAFRAGFDVHLNKPVSFPQLVGVLGEGDTESNPIHRKVKLRNHPLMTRKSGSKVWPPLWSNVRGSEYEKPKGEVGRLNRVEQHASIANSVFLWMEHGGGTYVGMLNFDDTAFCREIHRILETHVGFSIQEIGDIDLSHMF